MSDRAAPPVVIVGAGPAGIAAACAVAEAGRRAVVFDDNAQPGGQIWRGGHVPEEWMERLKRAGDRVEPRLRQIAGGLDAIAPPGSPVILCTGARERFLPFPGWTLPHVIGAGGLQALVKGGLKIAGRRVVVAGSGPLLLAVAAALRQHDAEVPLIAEQAPMSRLARFAGELLRRGEPGKIAQAVALRWALRDTPYRAGCWPVSTGAGWVRLSTGEHVACDYLACGFGLVPNTELAELLGCRVADGAVAVKQWQQTSVPHVYCAGEAAGVGGAELALLEGEIAGWSACGQTARAAMLFEARGRAQRFRALLAETFALRAELRRLAEPATIVCRCEDVPHARLAEHRSWRAAKLATRCGMGPCQGRICAPAARCLFGWDAGPARPPIYPASVGQLLSTSNTWNDTADKPSTS